MKKNILMKVFLILLPVMAVLFATTGDSVTVFDTKTGAAQDYSYFSVIPVGNLTMCTPLAGMLAVAAAVLAIIYVAKQKSWSIRGLFWVAPLSATAAVIPVLIHGETLVIPNVIFPIMMMAEWFLAHIAKKKPELMTAVKSGHRLKNK